jgi:hypothetical protein
MLYAIGEIALVVIGILIALQINNWNEWRNDRLKETQILLSLKEDFQANVIELEETIESLNQNIEWERSKLSYSGMNESALTPEIKDTIRWTGFVRSDLIDGTLTSVLNSEKLELISDESLKRLLTAYPSFLTKYKKQEVLIENYVLNEQRPIFRKYISLAEVLSDENPINQKIKKNVFKSDYSALLQDREYSNISIGILLNNQGLKEITLLLQSKTLNVLQLIEEELGETQ